MSEEDSNDEEDIHEEGHRKLWLRDLKRESILKICRSPPSKMVDFDATTLFLPPPSLRLPVLFSPANAKDPEQSHPTLPCKQIALQQVFVGTVPVLSRSSSLKLKRSSNSKIFKRKIFSLQAYNQPSSASSTLHSILGSHLCRLAELSYVLDYVSKLSLKSHQMFGSMYDVQESKLQS
ncbi:hypothetical protein B0H19DRAFT_1239342 [Mycena capillaripes]|nr:hypothetical protein B0H19DRAFT_1239342 [Mycena capillaripes]